MCIAPLALGKALDMDTVAREHLAQAAIMRVRDNFSMGKMCSATLAVYRELLDGSS